MTAWQHQYTRHGQGPMSKCFLEIQKLYYAVWCHNAIIILQSQCSPRVTALSRYHSSASRTVIWNSPSVISTCRHTLCLSHRAIMAAIHQAALRRWRRPDDVNSRRSSSSTAKGMSAVIWWRPWWWRPSPWVATVPDDRFSRPAWDLSSRKQDTANRDWIVWITCKFPMRVVGTQ